MEDKRKKKRKIFVLEMGVVFLIILVVFFVIGFLKKDTTFSKEENRMLTTKPKISIDEILSGEFESEYEQYKNDQFPFRNVFVKLKSIVSVAMGDREANGVVRGEDGYLMEKFTPYSEESNQKKLENLQKFIEENSNIKQYFLMVPTAINILEDKVPRGILLKSQDKRMDEFFQRFEEMGGTPIDVRDAFRENKDKELYYHTDHHWTSEGAYIAYKEAKKKLNLNKNIEYTKLSVYDNFQGSLTYNSGFYMNHRDVIDIYFPKKNSVYSVVNYVEEKKKTASLYNHEKLPTKESYEVFLDGNHSLIKIQSTVQNKAVLLVFKDSYANCFIPFLTQHYSEILVVDPRYYYGDIQELIKTEEVTKILYLYNANTFFTDTSLTNVLEQ